MGCYKNSQTAFKAWLIKKGLVDKFNNIKDLGQFRSEVTVWSKYYTDKYGSDRLAFDEGNKVVFNTETFRMIDLKQGNGLSQVEISIDKNNSRLYNDLLELTNDSTQAEILWNQTKTPEFKAWFKDSAVLDENGEPLIVYHGTDVNFEYFDKNKTGEFHSAGGELGRGFYFTKDLDYINNVLGSSITLPVFLSIQNPYIIKRILVKEGTDILFSAEYSTNLEKDYNFNLPKEYDGIIGDDRLQQVVVFESNQIKSVFNTGTFSSDKNIYYQQRTISPKKITPQVKEQLIGFLKEVNPNFRVEVIDNLSANGVANIAEFLIQLKKGKEDLALAEETAHVFLELLNDPKLKKDLLSDVLRTKMYKRVVEEYGQLYGMDYEKLKREAAAKLISLWIQDRDAFNYWSGSEQLNNNLSSIIQRVLNWIKRNFKNPYSKSAIRILKGSTAGIDVALVNESEIFYQINPERFETLDVKDITTFDKIFINLNNTLLDYKNYQAPDAYGKSGKVIKGLFFGDTRYQSELDKFYSTASLTKLGRELKDKMQLINAKRVVIFTDAPITDALVERLEDEFGQVNIVRTGYNIVETLFDEFGNPIDQVISGSQKEDYMRNVVKEFPNSNVLFVDNQSTSLFSENFPNLQLRLYSNDSAKYTDLQTQLNQEELKKKTIEFSQTVVEELSQVNKDSLLPLVKQSMNMVRNAISKLEKGDKMEELTDIFKDEYGNITVPLAKNAYIMERLLTDVDTFEQGLLNFVQTIESTRYFFNRANLNDYKELKQLLAEDNPESTDKAIREIAVLMRMILSWEQWVDGIQPLINDTKVLNKVIGEFRQELSVANQKLNQIAVNALSKSLESQWKPHNEAKKKLLDTGVISKKTYEETIYSAQKLADWLYGKYGDVHPGSAYFENPLMQSEPILQAISRRLEKSMIGADYKVMEKMIPFQKEMWTLGDDLKMTDEEIGKKITFVDQENYYEDGVMKQRPTTFLLNPFVNVWQREANEYQVKELRKKFVEAKNTGQPYEALELEYREAKDRLNKWIDQNWYDELTPEAKNIYVTFGIQDEYFELAKEKQSEIYEQLRFQTQLLQSVYLTEEMEDNANKEVERLIRDLRLLRNEYTEEGVLKTGDDLIIAQKLKQKSLIDRQIYDYQLDKGKFIDAVKEQIVSISNESVKSTLLNLLDTDNLYALKEFASLNAPQTFVDWLERNTRIKYSDNFYETRKNLIEQIKQISKDDRLDAVWKELTNSTSFLRDKDLVFDASDSTPDLQKLVKDYELYIESLKENSDTKPEVIPLIQQLSELQSKSASDYYNNLMYDWLKDIYMGISGSTNFTNLINSREFKDWFETAPQEFKDWFGRNHLTKMKWDEALQEKVPRITPTYIWMRTLPNSNEDILVVPSWKYNTRILKEEASIEFEGVVTDIRLKTPKIDWTTWNPVEKKWLPKSELFRNKDYFKLKDSSDPKDKTLFEYLTKVTQFHLGIQDRTEVGRDSVLGFRIPYYNKKYTEGNAIKTAYKAATDTLNPREEGTGSTAERKTSFWKKLLSFSGIESEEQVDQIKRTDYLGNEFKTVYTPYTQYLSPEDTTTNLVLSVSNYFAGVEKVKALVKDIPQLTLLEQVFEQFLPKQKGTLNQYGEQVNAGTNNRLNLLKHIVNTKLYADYKDFELGKGVDKFLVGLRKLTVMGSQSDLNIPNSIKNWMQGQLMNLIFAKDKGWASRKSILKAIRDSKTSYANYLYEMGKKDKSVDYYLLSFFNPLLERRTQDYSRGARSTELQDRVNLTGSYFSATASEFSVMSTLLYSHFYNQPVTIDGKEAKLYDAFTIQGGTLAIKPNAYIGDKLLTADYIQDLKLRFKVMMEDIQGKQWNQTMAQRYTVWQSLEFFKRFFIGMFRKRFFTKRENIELGETEGIYITTFKYLVRMLQGFLDSTSYNQAMTPDERRRIANARDEILLSISTLFLILYGFGFDEDDEDKYKKLESRSWLENMALLLAINTKRETDAFIPLPFTTIQQSVYPPVLNETYQFITNPFVGFTVINEGRKMLDSLLLLATGSDKAYYERDMPAHLIEKGDTKFGHYLNQVLQIDNFLYQASPEAKIQVVIQSQNR